MTKGNQHRRRACTGFPFGRLVWFMRQSVFVYHPPCTAEFSVSLHPVGRCVASSMVWLLGSRQWLADRRAERALVICLCFRAQCPSLKVDWISYRSSSRRIHWEVALSQQVLPKKNTVGMFFCVGIGLRCMLLHLDPKPHLLRQSLSKVCPLGLCARRRRAQARSVSFTGPIWIPQN